MMIDTPTSPILVDRQLNMPGMEPGRVVDASSRRFEGPGGVESTSPDQAAFLKQMAGRLGADPTDARAGTPEGLARLGAERMVSTALIEPLVREARESSASTGMFAPGPGEKRFGHLMDRSIADSIVASPGFGGVVSIERRLLERINISLGIHESSGAQVSGSTEERS